MQHNTTVEDIRVYVSACVDCLHVIQIAASEMELSPVMINNALFGLAYSMEFLLNEMDRHFMHIPTPVMEKAAELVEERRTGGCLHGQ